MNIEKKSVKRQIATSQEVSDEILNEFLNRANSSNNVVRISICRMELSFDPPRCYDIRCYLNDDIVDSAKLNGFVYRNDLSNEDRLIFDKK